MKRWVACLAMLLAAASAAAPAPALAQVAAQVEAVQMPAWLEREGRRTPLAPGMQLRAGDRVASGAGSRIVVRLSEGSLVKLGENGTLRLTRVDAGRGLFRATLDVLQGAFRFTTDLAEKARKREVTVGVADVVIGIRGTDFWGRSRDEAQIVCLIEGRVEVTAPGAAAVVLDQPLQFFRRERGAALPVGRVEPAQLEAWGRETEVQAGQGAARRGGRFSASILSTENPSEGARVRDRLRESGYPAEIRRAGERYEVRIRNLSSKADAEAISARIKREHNL